MKVVNCLSTFDMKILRKRGGKKRKSDATDNHVSGRVKYTVHALWEWRTLLDILAIVLSVVTLVSLYNQYDPGYSPSPKHSQEDARSTYKSSTSPPIGRGVVIDTEGVSLDICARSRLKPEVA